MASATKAWAGLIGIVVLVVFVAGFFHGENRKECAPSPTLGSKGAARAEEYQKKGPGHAVFNEGAERGAAVVYDAARPAAGLLALTASPGYRRAAEMSLRVADCTKAEDELETRLVALRGEILDMLMEGIEGSRTCSLTVLIPSDSFREFVSELRKMGKIQTERITASRLKPGAPVEGPDNPDIRELSLVSIRMADEKVAKEVLEGQGVLMTSFNRSTSHFLRGLAVVVEGLGYVLPFVLAFMAAAVPFALGARLRRMRAARISG